MRDGYAGVYGVDTGGETYFFGVQATGSRSRRRPRDTAKYTGRSKEVPGTGVDKWVRGGAAMLIYPPSNFLKAVLATSPTFLLDTYYRLPDHDLHPTRSLPVHAIYAAAYVLTWPLAAYAYARCGYAPTSRGWGLAVLTWPLALVFTAVALTLDYAATLGSRHRD